MRSEPYTLGKKVLLWGMVLSLTALCGGFGGPETTGFAADEAKVLPLNSEGLTPGLSVVYLYGFWRHVDKMLADGKALSGSKPGKPIPFLNHDFGRGEVFDSGEKQGVGVRMTGYIRLDPPGDYRLLMKSNDGVRVFVDGKMIIDDPDQHAARFSSPATVHAPRAGWYPLKIDYFQRKGTAGLEMFWQPPGEAAFRVVPAEVLAHSEK